MTVLVLVPLRLAYRFVVGEAIHWTMAVFIVVAMVIGIYASF
jgi:hypothetical protein